MVLGVYVVPFAYNLAHGLACEHDVASEHAVVLLKRTAPIVFLMRPPDLFLWRTSVDLFVLSDFLTYAKPVVEQ